MACFRSKRSLLIRAEVKIGSRAFRALELFLLSSLQNGVGGFGVLHSTLYNASMGASLEQKRLTSFDGTEISYHVGGSGPAVVLANGLGGPLPAYRYIIEQLIPDYRVLTWDYRGLYNSGTPPQKNDLSVEHSVEDMHCLMAEEGLIQNFLQPMNKQY